jgi:hypothetical protein
MNDYSWHWTNMTCTLHMKGIYVGCCHLRFNCLNFCFFIFLLSADKLYILVNEIGHVTIVHDPDLIINAGLSDDHIIVRHEFDVNNAYYFSFMWDAGYLPSPINKCGNGVFVLTEEACYCNVTVLESRVFNATPSTATEVLKRLFIGNIPPDLNVSVYTPRKGSAEVQVFHKNLGA